MRTLSNRKGTLFVISGASGTGKGTIIQSYFDNCKDDNIFLSISATTRQPREGETDGINYYFKTRDEFEKLIETGGVLEWASFCGNYYGTPKDKVVEMLNAGKDVILEIEVQGAMQVRREHPEGVFIFVLPPSFAELRSRILNRQSETPEAIEDRMKTAKIEFSHINRYDYILLNDTIEAATNRLRHIIEAERCKVNRNMTFIEEVLAK